ncbi:uncharacterized protein LOC130816874 isoform X1 [Amaranthus tricolor]|uniref:uncharacterized protein LOC130816874 isoform X1 n=1 Tax=Amaranthus tricolor TaxID=29722 RepID=UPI002583E56F|nr:uncharacterized protein LOC130816874 isoform X1 [Amaranthus tricolor]
MAAASKSVLMILLLISELSALVLMASTQPDLLSPLLSPIIGNICKRVGCGRGNCKMSENSVFEYKCECDPGWKQSLFDNSTHLNFLPCVIPNCTLNYSCAATPTTQQTPSNTSTNDPCRWANCGGGLCNKTSELTYQCHCKEGYNNLFNNTAFPCLNECSIGGDCPNLGLSVANRSTSAPPSLPERGSNQANSQKHGVLSYGMIAFAVSIVALVV